MKLILKDDFGKVYLLFIFCLIAFAVIDAVANN